MKIDNILAVLFVAMMMVSVVSAPLMFCAPQDGNDYGNPCGSDERR